jgi:hypothetical protein
MTIGGEGIGVLLTCAGRGGVGVGMPSVMGWEEGTGSSTIQAMTGPSSSEESPDQTVAV